MTEAELFVAVLGASNYTYAEATRTQRILDRRASHQRASQFFGGVTTAVVCDQLKSAVTLACRYEPGLQRTYEAHVEALLCGLGRNELFTRPSVLARHREAP